MSDLITKNLIADDPTDHRKGSNTVLKIIIELNAHINTNLWDEDTLLGYLFYHEGLFKKSKQFVSVADVKLKENDTPSVPV